MDMKRAKPLSELTFDELHEPANRRAVLRRGAAIRRRRANLPENAPLPGFSFEDAVEEITVHAHDRKKARGARPAPRGSAALRQRMHRLRKLAPAGVTLDVWHEIVAHFKGACHVDGCGRLACRVGRIADGTPVPACVAHALPVGGS